MLSGEKKRLSIRFRNRPYNPVANAVLPTTTATQSAVADGDVSTARLAVGKTRQAINNDCRSFIHIATDPNAIGSVVLPSLLASFPVCDRMLYPLLGYSELLLSRNLHSWRNAKAVAQ